MAAKQMSSANDKAYFLASSLNVTFISSFLRWNKLFYSQNVWGWTRPVETIYSNLSCPGLWMAFEYPKGWTLHNPSGQSLSVVDNPHGNYFFLYWNRTYCIL